MNRKPTAARMLDVVVRCRFVLLIGVAVMMSPQWRTWVLLFVLTGAYWGLIAFCTRQEMRGRAAQPPPMDRRYFTGEEALFLEPVLGLRVWRTDGIGLFGVFFPTYRWQPGVNVAGCPKTPPCLSIPDPDCGCGFYAGNDISYVSTSQREAPISIVGVVALSGRVCVGEKGYQAEKAQVVALVASGNIAPAFDVPRFSTVEAMLAECPLSRIEIPA